MKLGIVAGYVLLILALSGFSEQEQRPAFSIHRQKDPPFDVYEREALPIRTWRGMAVYEKDDPNRRLHPLLMPNEVPFVRATGGENVTFGTVIVMPPTGEAGFLTIEYRRSDFLDSFIDGFFFGADRFLVKHHPYLAPGIEAILTDERLILNVHAGAIFHVRKDVPNDGTRYKTFSNSNASGKITKVEGSVYYSVDPSMVSMKLDKFYNPKWTQSLRLTPGAIYKRGSDGDYEIIVPNPDFDLPKTYAPRVIKGR